MQIQLLTNLITQANWHGNYYYYSYIYAIYLGVYFYTQRWWAEGAESLGISHRELEVFALVAEGYNNKEVAEILHIKHQSVATMSSKK